MSAAPHIDNSSDSARTSATMAAVGQAFTVFIETGFHAGTVQRLSAGSYTLGSELDADIVLSDDGIQPIHLIVDLDPKGLRLEPLQGAVKVQGESDTLEPGGERHLTAPASFKVGDTLIKITAPADSVQSRRRRRIMFAAAGCVMLAVVGFQVANLSEGTGLRDAPDGPGQASMQLIDRPDSPITSSDSTRGTAGAAPTDQAGAPDGDDVAELEPDITLDQAAAALRERLAAEDFADIKVQTAVDRIMVRGEAEPERMDGWQAIRIWFDGTYGRDFLLVATIEPAKNETPPDLAIEAVWSGDDPYLVAGGQRFFVGAHVGDGWTIERIGSDEIRFKRNGKSFSLTL